MDKSTGGGTRRAPRQGYLQERAGREAARPLHPELLEWHQKSARLGAALNRATLRGADTTETARRISDLAALVRSRREQWAAEANGHAQSSHVHDVRRSCDAILDTLAALLADARRAAPGKN
jgi:hypothetical protein